MSRPEARSANLLGTVGLAVSDRIRAAGEEELGLGGSAPVAIVALSTYLAGRPLEELADAFGITASAVVRMVDRLEREGLAQRRPGPDGRRVAVRLTAKGDRRAKAILARRERELAGVLGTLTQAEQRELTRLHEKLLARLPDGVPSARRVCRFCDIEACGHHDGRCPVTAGIDERGLRGG
jgi:MarR family transcriptional regulator, negative regulator of the multidrug operon emrRAB